MLSRKIFKVLHGVITFLELFGQLLIKLFAPHLVFFTNMMHFVRTFSIYARLHQCRDTETWLEIQLLYLRTETLSISENDVRVGYQY